MSDTDVWSFETKREEQRIRLDAIRLAFQMHESGTLDTRDNTVLQTATKIMDFIAT